MTVVEVCVYVHLRSSVNYSLDGCMREWRITLPYLLVREVHVLHLRCSPSVF